MLGVDSDSEPEPEQAKPQARHKELPRATKELGARPSAILKQQMELKRLKELERSLGSGKGTKELGAKAKERKKAEEKRKEMGVKWSSNGVGPPRRGSRNRDAAAQDEARCRGGHV